MGFDLKKLTEDLYVPATKAFEEKGFSTKIDTSDKENPKFIAQKADTTIIIPVNKNIVIYEQASTKKQTVQTFNTINVYNGTDFYISMDVLNEVK